jgi:hypothetical protein
MIVRRKLRQGELVSEGLFRGFTSLITWVFGLAVEVINVRGKLVPGVEQ